MMIIFDDDDDIYDDNDGEDDDDGTDDDDDDHLWIEARVWQELSHDECVVNFPSLNTFHDNDDDEIHDDHSWAQNAIDLYNVDSISEVMTINKIVMHDECGEDFVYQTMKAFWRIIMVILTKTLWHCDLFPSVITCVDLLKLLHFLVEFELRNLRK